MTAEIVTESSSADGASGDESTSGDPDGTSGQNSVSEEDSSDDQDASGQGSPDEQSGNGNTTGMVDSSVQSSAGDSGITVNEDTGGTAAAQSEESDLNSAQGLSLSTAPASEENITGVSGSVGPLTWILILTVSITLSGAILMLLGAYLVYLFRKNWKLWGGQDIVLTEEDMADENEVFLAGGFGLADEPEDGVWDSEGVVRESEEGWDEE